MEMAETAERIVDTWNTIVETCAENGKINLNISQPCSNLINQDKKVLKFFWLDAFRNFYQPGTLILFGKTFNESSRRYTTSALIVRHLQRTIHLLPRERFLNDASRPVRLIDVHDEFKATVAWNLRVDRFQSKPVVRNYISDPSIPSRSEYLEIKYSARHQEMKQKSGVTFSKVFGSGADLIESFLLERKMKGPCWLNVTNYHCESPRLTYCPREYTCYKADDVCVSEEEIPPPPLVVAAISFRSMYTKSPDVTRPKEEIVFASCVVHQQYDLEKQTPQSSFQQNYSVFTCPAQTPLPTDFNEVLGTCKNAKVLRTENEKALLCRFVDVLAKVDPDVIVGHEFYDKRLGQLHRKLHLYGVKSYAKCGRFAYKRFPDYPKDLICGRLICDLKVSARELVKCPSYDLNALCRKVLNVELPDIQSEKIPEFFADSSRLVDLTAANILSAVYVLKLAYALNVIPLALRLTNICGNLMSRTLLGGPSERIEFLLLHALIERDYIIPQMNKKVLESEGLQATSRTAYVGGLVLPPKTGLYDTLILHMDFKSLYPSIIQEFNVCFTTFSANEQGNAVPLQSSSVGILPSVIKPLVDRRSDIKRLMSEIDGNSGAYAQHDIHQTALKLMANGVYGYLGFDKSRFYAKHLAAFIAEKGREILTDAKKSVEEMSYEVVYGDTDSLMIKTDSTDYEEALSIGRTIYEKVNRRYRYVRLEVEGVFKHLLLLKKKRYADVSVNKIDGELRYAEEYKGLEIVRRDWSGISSEAGKAVLKILFSELPYVHRADNIYEYLSRLRQNMRHEIGTDLFVIMRQLTKHPDEYSEPDKFSHVTIALRLNAAYKRLSKGDVIPYVICSDGTDRPTYQRAYHLDEFKSSSSLEIDRDFYLSKQIYPVVSRLCQPLNFIRNEQIALSLGVDLNKMKSERQVKENEPLVQPDENEQNKCAPFIFKCYRCHTENSMTKLTSSLEKCANPDCSSIPIDRIGYIRNQLSFTLRAFIRKFYSFEMTCDNVICGTITPFVPLRYDDGVPSCNVCGNGKLRLNYSAKNLYDQLMYFREVFSVQPSATGNLLHPTVVSGYAKLKEIVEKTLRLSGYDKIDVFDLFATSLPENFNASINT